MFKNFYLIAFISLFAVCSCSEVDTKEDANTTATEPSRTVNTEVKLRDRLPATCKVDNSDNLGFCLPGDTLIYRPDPKKEDQKDTLDVIGDFCAQEKPIIITDKGLACTFRENRTYTADPINQQAIVGSNRTIAREYLSAIAKIPGIKEAVKGIYVIKLENGSKDAPDITDKNDVEIEAKLLTLDLKVHSYMLNDRLSMSKLGKNNPFASILPGLKQGDTVRAYIDFEVFPGIWNVSNSMTGLPYIWEVKILSVNEGNETDSTASSQED